MGCPLLLTYFPSCSVGNDFTISLAVLFFIHWRLLTRESFISSLRTLSDRPPSHSSLMSSITWVKLSTDNFPPELTDSSRKRLGDGAFPVSPQWGAAGVFLSFILSWRILLLSFFWRYDCEESKCIIFKLFIWTNRLCTHYEIALRWMTRYLTNVNIGLGNGLMLSCKKPLHEYFSQILGTQTWSYIAKFWHKFQDPCIISLLQIP